MQIHPLKVSRHDGPNFDIPPSSQIETSFGVTVGSPAHTDRIPSLAHHDVNGIHRVRDGEGRALRRARSLKLLIGQKGFGAHCEVRYQVGEGGSESRTRTLALVHELYNLQSTQLPSLPPAAAAPLGMDGGFSERERERESGIMSAYNL